MYMKKQNKSELNKININTSEQWNHLFRTKKWELRGGYSQTKNFAKAQISQFNISSDFNGTICDFGCGAGDAFPVYHHTYPNATLIGVDFSKEAIKLCIDKYNNLAKFYCGTANDVPIVDIIICSNVIEHIIDDINIVKQLLMRCKTLYIIVPYEEQLFSLFDEYQHIQTYNENSFFDLKPIRISIFFSKGWTQYGFDLWINVYVKNIIRFLIRKTLQKRKKQIMFEFFSKQ